MEPSHWSLEILSYPPDISPIVQALQTGTAFAVCNGSLKNEHGTAAFVLQNHHHREGRVLGCNRTPGWPCNQSSFQSKLGGILGVIFLTQKICDEFSIMDGSITLGCDCLSALQMVFQFEWDDPQQNCCDLIHLAQSTLQTSPLNWKWQHIKAHQDTYTAFASLDWCSQLNVKMDN